MVDIQPLVVSKLNEIGIPVLYELLVDNTTPTPCITYLEMDNADRISGDSLSYVNVTFQLKVQTRDLKEVRDYSAAADSKMKGLGFSRFMKDELVIDGICSRVMRYSAIAYKQTN